MIQMVMTVNDTTKEVGDKAVVEKVSCFTCHQGKGKPAIQPEAGWGRGGFSLLPAGPPLPPARGGTSKTRTTGTTGTRVRRVRGTN